MEKIELSDLNLVAALMRLEAKAVLRGMEPSTIFPGLDRATAMAIRQLSLDELVVKLEEVGI